MFNSFVNTGKRLVSRTTRFRANPRALMTTIPRRTHLGAQTGPPSPCFSVQPTNATAIRMFSTGIQVTDFINDTISSNKVVVFSKTTCGYCAATKRLFEGMGVDAEVIELNLREDGQLIQNELYNLTRQRSVPNVFVNGQHVGGNDDTQAAARSGKLETMLK